MKNRIGWYYAHAGKRFGPITTEQLRDLALIWQISRDDLVWRRGMSEWRHAGEVDGLLPASLDEPHPERYHRRARA